MSEYSSTLCLISPQSAQSDLRMKKPHLFTLGLLLSLQLSPLQAQCLVDPDNSAHWPHWPPILTNQEGDLLLPTGTDNDRLLSMAEDEVVLFDPVEDVPDVGDLVGDPEGLLLLLLPLEGLRLMTLDGVLLAFFLSVS